MDSIRKFIKGLGFFLLVLIALPMILLRSGWTKIVKTVSKAPSNKTAEIDKFVQSLTSEAHADVGTYGSAASTGGCGHDQGGY